jgi:hypothetical protein
VLPCRPRDAKAAEVLRAAIGDVLGNERALRAGAPGSADAGELVAAAADATILVAAPGIRVTDVSETLDILARYGTTPTYAVLAGRHGSDEPQGIVVAETANASSAASAS